MEVYQQGMGREGKNEGKGAEIKKHHQQVQNRQGCVKTNIGNGEAKELTSMTHAHELRQGLLSEIGVPGGGGQKGENWDNFNNIINSIYFLKKKR